MQAVGNPDGQDKPNKKVKSLAYPLSSNILITFGKFFDPRVWVRAGEQTMSERVKEALQDFNAAGQVS